MFLSMIFHLLLFTDATLTSLRAVCMKTIFLQIAVAWTSAGGRKDVILRLNTSVLFLVPALTRIDEQAKLEFKLNKNKRDIFAVSLLILLVMEIWSQSVSGERRRILYVLFKHRKRNAHVKGHLPWPRQLHKKWTLDSRFLTITDTTVHDECYCRSLAKRNGRIIVLIVISTLKHHINLVSSFLIICALNSILSMSWKFFFMLKIALIVNCKGRGVENWRTREANWVGTSNTSDIDW